MLIKAFTSLQFLVLIAIYTQLGLMSRPQDVLPLTTNDLMMHFAGYVAAAFSISLARPYWSLWTRSLVLLAYSIGIEILQHFNPPRTFSIADIAANAAGIALGLLIVAVVSKRFALCEHFLNHQVFRK